MLPTASKKDPYAFDDEEVEITSQPNQENITHSSANAATATSSSPLQSHRFSTAFVSSGATTVAAVVSSAHINTAPVDSLHSVSSSVSPNAIVGGGSGGGPPLKLRFAMEAGHYTVMENQENPSEQAAATVASSAAITATVSASTATIANDVPPMEEGMVITNAEELNQGLPMDANFKLESGEQVSFNID